MARKTTIEADPVPSPAPSKVRDSGVTLMKFEMSDCFIHVWTGPVEAWEAGPGAPGEGGGPRSEWAAHHPDLDVTRIVAVRCELKPESAAEREPVEGRADPDPMSVRKLRRLRATVLDAIEQSDDVTSILVTAGGDGRCEMQVSLSPDPEDRRPGRMNAMDPGMFVRITFFDDESEAW